MSLKPSRETVSIKFFTMGRKRMGRKVEKKGKKEGFGRRRGSTDLKDTVRKGSFVPSRRGGG